jgi:hypothetical protein
MAVHSVQLYLSKHGQTRSFHQNSAIETGFNAKENSMEVTCSHKNLALRSSAKTSASFALSKNPANLEQSHQTMSQTGSHFIFGADVTAVSKPKTLPPSFLC